MKKLEFRLPAEITIEAENLEEATVRDAVKKKVKSYQHPHRFEKKIMTAFSKKKFTVKEKE